MNAKNIFNLIYLLSKETGVSLVLIGGFAVNYYHVTRQTADVDFLVTKEDFEKLIPLLEKSGYSKDYSQEVFARFKSNKLYLMDIDFMFVERDTFEKILKASKKASISGHQFIVPSLNNLIALKLHSLKNNFKLRENKDLPDIIEMIRINNVNYRDKGFKELCLKYGTEGIYNKIIHRL